MAQTNLGESLRGIEREIAAGRAAEALAQCLELQTQYPRALAAQRVLGEIYLSLRKPREALGALERTLAGDPEDARALCARAIVYQMHGDSMAALGWYRRACDVRPEDQVLRSTYQELATQLGQPPYQPTRVGLARLYLRGDLFAHALREWDALLHDTPDLLEAQVGLAETLWRTQRIEEAEALCERILTNAPACVKATLLLAAMRYDAGRGEEALRLALRARDLDPEQRIGHMLYGDRLTAGDAGLRALLNGELQDERPPHNRPLVGSRPLGVSAGRDAAELAARPLSSLDLGAKVPEEFQGLFSETEFMLWGPDEETRTRLAAQALEATDKYPRVKPPAKTTIKPAEIRAETPAEVPDAPTAPTPTPPIAAPVERATRPPAPAPAAPFVPPALREHGMSLQDAEARDAIGWVNWLQSQGARTDGSAPGAPAPPPSAPPPAPVSAREEAPGAGTPSRTDAPTVKAPISGASDGAGALRAMFAELGPAPGGESETERLARVKALAQQADVTRPEGVTQLESLEANFVASGYEQMDPRPGILASLAAGEEAARALGVDMSAEIPDSTDYPTRLRRARQWRAEGRLDAAFAEYRVLLKLAPELLPDVVTEVEEVLRAAPTHPEAHRLLGDARIKQGDYLGALEEYNRAVALAQQPGL